jgi:hypothetical protein
MPLELAPDVEREVQERADRTGMTPSEFIHTLLQVTTKPTTPSSQTKRGKEQEERLAQARAKMHAWQQEYGLPVPEDGFKSTATLFEQWRAEDANMTPQEQEEERRFWAEFHAQTERASL